MKAMAVFWVMGALSCIGVGTASATTVYLNGRLLPVDTDVRGPLMPSDREECERFKEDADKTGKEISQDHDQCLEAHRGSGGSLDGEMGQSDGRKVSRCTVSFCQHLHTGRDEYREKVHEAYSQCLREVRQKEQSYGARSVTSDDSAEHEDFHDYVLERSFKGPKEGLWKYAKQEISKAIDKYFSSYARMGKQSVRVAEATDFLWNSTSKIRSKCAEAHDAQVRTKCDQELIDAISSLPRKVPTEFRYDPAIDLIQRAMMEKLQVIMRDVNANLKEVQQGMDDVAENGSVPPSAARRRSRTTPLIENR